MFIIYYPGENPIHFIKLQPMKKVWVIILILNLLNKSLFSQNNFVTGERLEYQIHYGPLNAGIINTSLNLVDLDGQQVYHSRAIAKSVGLADKLYKIRDIYEGYFDTVTILPLKSIRDISEGRYKKYNVVHYDHNNLMANSIRSGEQEIPPDIRDMTSAFYYVRTIDYDTLVMGDIILLNTFFDDELFPFDIRYKGREEIKTKTGVFNCIKLVPFVEPGRIFKSEDDMTVWISDDPNHVPIRVRFNLIVGAILCDLISYSGLKY